MHYLFIPKDCYFLLYSYLNTSTCNEPVSICFDIDNQTKVWCMECNLRSSPSIGPWWPHSSTLTCSLSFWAYTACVFLLAIFFHYSNLTVQIFWIGLLDSLMTCGDALFVWILKSKPLQPELEFVCCCAFGFKFSQLVCCVSSPPATQSALAHPSTPIHTPHSSHLLSGAPAVPMQYISDIFWNKAVSEISSVPLYHKIYTVWNQWRW